MNDLSGPRTLTAVACLALAGAPAALAAPTTVYFWNTANDAAMRTSEASIWQDMGLLDASGRMGQIQANDDIKVNNVVVGRLIKREGVVVGVRSADGTKEACDLTRATSLKTDGYDQIVNGGGTLDIRVHGLRRNIQGPPAATRTGGAFRVGNDWKAGFKTQGAAAGGTGVGAPTNGTIDFPAVNAGCANLDLNICYGGNDPDGAGPERSVATSARDILGVCGIVAHADVSTTRTSTRYLGGTAAQRTEAFRKAIREANDNGFQVTAAERPDLNASQRNHLAVARYLSSLTLADRSAFQGRIETGDAKLVVTYTTPQGQSHNRSTPSNGPGSTDDGLGVDPDDTVDVADFYTPYTLVEPFTSGTVLLSAFDEGPDAPATLSIPAGALSAETMIFINQLASLPAPAPFGLPYLASGVFDFRGDTFTPSLLSNLDYSLALIAGTEPGAQFFRFGPSGWEPLTNASIFNGRISASMPEVGLVAAFSSVPTPGAAATFAVMTLLAARRRREPSVVRLGS